MPLTRRNCLQGALASLALARPRLRAAEDAAFKLATFTADVTVPIGHGMMGGAWKSTKVADPLEARGIVLTSADDQPIVFVAVDWCEVRNDAYTAWQTSLAKAAETSAQRVLVSTVHQHEAPVADLTAEAILREHRRAGSVCDPLFHDKAVAGVAKALQAALQRAKPVTHIACGQAKVEKIASNRRYVTEDGAVHYDRMSATRNAAAIAADDGTIDSWLKSLTFLNRDEPLVTLSFYATHPMSYYRTGEISADFPGIARRKRQEETPGALQIYCSGASGNVTAGKYNNGARENRPVLADRLYAAMAAAAKNARREPLTKLGFRSVPVAFEPRDGKGFTVEDLETTLKTHADPFQQCLAALGLSWRRRCVDGKPIAIPAIDFGGAVLLLLPGEAYVEFQLAAQQLCPDKFVCVAGYGDGATGYIPTALQLKEHDGNLADWCWVAPDSEEKLLAAMKQALMC
jgi:hypothetical protein